MTTREKIEEIKASAERQDRGESIQYVPPWMLIALCDSALRLAAIESAGDDEVDMLVKSVARPPGCTRDHVVCQLGEIAISRNATIADLRAKLGEATELLRTLYDSPSIGEVAHDDTYYRLEKFVTESEVQGG